MQKMKELYPELAQKLQCQAAYVRTLSNEKQVFPTLYFFRSGIFLKD